MNDRISNADARRLFLYLHGLSDLKDRKYEDHHLPHMINKIGFVQIDSIKTVERAHHHILFSRLKSYERTWLKKHLEDEGTLFENWTHDASIIPMVFFPYWRPRFKRAEEKINKSKWWRKRIGNDPDAICSEVLNYIETNGPARARDIKLPNDMSTREFESETWWGWNPSKAALVFLWRTGQLAVKGRENFQKVYDLTKNVIPKNILELEPTLEDFVSWNCTTALDRIGFGTESEIARYWDGITVEEAKIWCGENGRNSIRKMEIEDAEGNPRQIYARVDIAELLEMVPEPPKRVRFLSPFDPLIRDRKRTQRLFGFDFKIEIFIPEKKREYGYYVCPVLEGAEFIGRIELKSNKGSSCLVVKGLWLEAGIVLTKSLTRKIEDELYRWKKFMALNAVEWVF